LTPSRPVSTIERWWPVFLWSGIIFAMSSVPGSRLDEVGLSVPDKLVHASEYAILGFLALRAHTRGGNALDRRVVAVAVLTGICVGALDETYQRLIPQRDSSAKDWVADVVGTAFGVLFAAGLVWRQRSARRSTR
jgi:VanZ family protein